MHAIPGTPRDCLFFLVIKYLEPGQGDRDIFRQTLRMRSRIPPPTGSTPRPVIPKPVALVTSARQGRCGCSDFMIVAQFVPEVEVSEKLDEMFLGVLGAIAACDKWASALSRFVTGLPRFWGLVPTVVGLGAVHIVRTDRHGVFCLNGGLLGGSAWDFGKGERGKCDPKLAADLSGHVATIAGALLDSVAVISEMLTGGHLDGWAKNLGPSIVARAAGAAVEGLNFLCPCVTGHTCKGGTQSCVQVLTDGHDSLLVKNGGVVKAGLLERHVEE